MRPSNFQGNVHIINFPAGTSPADLAALFDDFGLVMGAQIKTIASTGGNLRLGIVSVAPDKAADQAIEALQGYQMGGQKLKLVRPKPPAPAEPKAKGPRAPRPAVSRVPAPRPGPMQPALAVRDDAYPSQAYDEPPRKVIVEYKKRRGVSRL